MRWAACGIWVLGLAAGCRGDGVVEVVVLPPEGGGIDKIALVIGVGPETTQDVTADGPTFHGAHWWKHDHGQLVVDEASTAGEPVVFAYRAGEYDEIAAAIAVGASGEVPRAAAALFDAHIPDDAARYRYEVRLSPLGPPSSALHVWGPRGQNPRCAALHHAGPRSPLLVVGADDPDCDGFPSSDPLECRPAIYEGVAPAALADTTCLVSTMFETGAADEPGCVLGGPGCVDGRGARPCEETAFCTFPSVCGRCMNDLTCAKQLAGDSTAGPITTCRFHAQQVGGELVVCPAGSQLDRAGDFPAGSCKDAWIADAQHGFASDLQLVDGQGAALNLSVAMRPDTCAIQLTASGVVVQSVPGRFEYPVMVAGTLAGGRGFAVPLKIYFEIVTNACPMTPTTCTIPQGLGPCLGAALPRGADPRHRP